MLMRSEDKHVNAHALSEGQKVTEIKQKKQLTLKYEKSELICGLVRVPLN